MADDGLEGFIPAPLTLTTTGTGTGTGTITAIVTPRSNQGEGGGGGQGMGDDSDNGVGVTIIAIDPTGLPFEEIALSLQQAVAECLDAEDAERENENSATDDHNSDMNNSNYMWVHVSMCVRVYVHECKHVYVWSYFSHYETIKSDDIVSIIT